MAAGVEAMAPHITGLSIDSRTIKLGEIFFAIIGDRHDGHDYVEQAFAQGAAAAVISRSRIERYAGKQLGPMFVVDDTHEALLNLAGYLRRHSEARFAAVTGSNGKTTTKEMLYAIMKVRHAVYRSPGNLNNLYGLPISLGQMPEEAQFAVFELGISVPGEMSRLASIIKPDLALMTNIGPAHLETLRSIDQIVKAKFELVDRLPVGAAVILNADDPRLTAEAARRKLDFVGFGIDHECRFRGRLVRSEGECGMVFEIEGQTIHLPLVGRINVYNALAAIAASSVWGAAPEDWVAGLESFQPVEMRLALEEYRGWHLLIDCYNANPESVSAALAALAEMKVTGKKIAVLGDMLELGVESERLHEQIGRAAAVAGLDHLLCLGPQSAATAKAAMSAGLAAPAVGHYLTHPELLNALLAVVGRGDLILFKGSRGMELEKIVVGLKASASENS